MREEIHEDLREEIVKCKTARSDFAKKFTKKGVGIGWTNTNVHIPYLDKYIDENFIFSNKNAYTLIGTCNYVAPELCDGKPYDRKSDIWSLGCILYELCAMEKMFEGTLSNVVLSIAAGRRKQVDTEVYGIQMQQIIEMMLQVDPEARPDTVKIMNLPDIFPSLYVLGANLGCINNPENTKRT